MKKIQLDKLREVEYTMRAFRWFKNKTGHSLLSKGIPQDMITDEDISINLMVAGLIGGKAEENEDQLVEIAENHFSVSLYGQFIECFTEGVEILTGEPEKK